MLQEYHPRGWMLRHSGRFAHSTQYVHELAAQHGFEVVVTDVVVGRKDGPKPIKSGVFVLQRV